MPQFLKFIFGIKLYMFRTVPLSIIRSFSLCAQQYYISYRFADSLRTESGRTLPTSCTMGTVSFPGVKCGRGVLLTTHHLPVPRSWNSRAIPLPTLWATPGL